MDLLTELTSGKQSKMAITVNVEVDELTDVDEKAKYVIFLLNDDYHVRIEGCNKVGMFVRPGEPIESIKHTIRTIRESV